VDEQCRDVVRNEVVMPDEVIIALEQQVQCYRRLAKLAELQHVHVQQEQTEALLEVLRTRQGVLDEISSLERIILPARQTWTAYTAGLTSPDRLKADTLLAETRRLLEEITSADRNDALVLQQRKLNVGKQINKTRSAQVVNRRYATSYGPRKSTLDLQR
jgi:hypothetical protein